ncbi:helix-turn-helix domain-containing protein [Streptomyces sp. NPDC051243]|uniref:helix-turn-helix domain-containing protein n=1 Tax=Streptomyces sp. NPDC051243 TaxID=3365646 RepID=UPI003788CDD3
MVESSWIGLRVPAIADELRCSPNTVRRWLHRFNLMGLHGLEDLGGRGRRRRISEAERSRVIGLANRCRRVGRPCRRTVSWPRRRSPGRRSGPLTPWPQRPAG